MSGTELSNAPVVDRIPQEILDAIFGIVYDSLEGLKLRYAPDATQDSLCTLNFGLLIVHKTYSKRFEAELYKRAQICLPNHTNTIQILSSSAKLGLFQHIALPPTMRYELDPHPTISLRQLMGAIPSLKTLDFRIVGIPQFEFDGTIAAQHAVMVTHFIEDRLLVDMDPHGGSEDYQSVIAPIISVYETAYLTQNLLREYMMDASNPDLETGDRSPSDLQRAPLHVGDKTSALQSSSASRAPDNARRSCQIQCGYETRDHRLDSP